MSDTQSPRIEQFEQALEDIVSPLARALIGKGQGDSVEVSTPRGPKSYEVVTVDFG